LEPGNGDEQVHVPPPSLWPIGFAVGFAVVLVGLIVDPTVIAPIGGAIALVFGFLWVRASSRELRAAPAGAEPELREAGVGDAPALPALAGGPAMPPSSPGETFPRSRFLELSTLGIGGVIGGLVTLPVAGFALVPSFIDQKKHRVDVGPLENFPEGQYVVTTFIHDPAEGEVSRRTAYIRNNGNVKGGPSFTIISNRCAHLGCPVQPNGPMFDKEQKKVSSPNGKVTLIPTLPAGGFGCPCHGGQYDTEGNRTAGPPVRALDRYDYEIANGRLVLLSPYSVGKVDGTGATARIHKYKLVGPGEHVDGPEQIFYPLNPPHG
jgi:Rieske Fe-S protein